jgi:Fe-S cluster assembly protein SufD
LAGHNRSLDSHSLDCTLHKNWSDRGVLFGSLDEMLTEHSELLRPYFQTAFDPTHDRFSALHAAFWTGGHVLYVPRGVVVDEPLHALSSMTDGGTDLGHVLVVLEDGAEATLLCESSSLSNTAGGFHCGAVELILGAGSHLRFVNLQDWGAGVWHFAHEKALIRQDATLQWTVAALGSRLAKVNQRVALVGQGGSCQVNGVLFTEGKQHLSYDTLQHHEAPNCRSDFLYKAALQDKSRTVWRGMIKVDVEAQKTDGYQRNDNLLLSSNARADSIPGLEIEADDVRCTHGSTSGCVDEELIFYAGCRGFSRKEAIRMIVTGFFQHIFDRITIENVREALALAIARRVREYE